MDEDKKDTATQKPEHSSTSKSTVLIVEDDSVLKKMYEQKLTSDGYNVFGAADGESGFEIFNSENIDFLLTDIMLPGISGVELLEKIRATTKGKNLPVVAWSNLHDEEIEKKAFDLGVKEFLAKGSLTLDQISEVVKKYI